MNNCCKTSVALSALLALTTLHVPASAQTATPEQIVETMRALAGKQKIRPSGAKGQCYTGTFTPTEDAKKLTRSVAFEKPSKVLARFSVGGNNPRVPDTTKSVNRGFSFRIDDGGRGQTAFVMANAPVNFVRSPDQMLAFLQARLPGTDGKPDPAKIKAFTDANPETTNQGKWLAGKPVPASWAGQSYWGVHAYTLTNAGGAKQLVKFKMVPADGEAGLTDDEAKTKPADFLVDELAARLAAKKATGFDMIAILGKDGDEPRPATERWVDEDARPTVKLGRLAITAVEKNETCDQGVFDPGNLARGVDGPADPLFTARQPAYAVSITNRN